MGTIRKILLVLLIAAFAAVAATFAYLNPGNLDLDLGFVAIEEISKPLAFAVSFARGWLFGLACAASAVMKYFAQRQRLQRDLRVAESEVSSLRSLPLNDAH